MAASVTSRNSGPAEPDSCRNTGTGPVSRSSISQYDPYAQPKELRTVSRAPRIAV
ncbi:hypothetical protein [Dactylosporangium sp. NPDC049140]|uniref:hypothetical protein n=1 Tax=Dactylosporangium sp. NPDC049140 TaxID=3155647 RepID=UPI003404EA7C